MNPAFESLCALSVILDLANGLAEDKSVLAATLAWELARDAGLDEEQQWAALLAAMLRHLGCTAYASVEAGIADDVALRRNLHLRDSGRPLDVLDAVTASHQGLVGKARGLIALVSAGPAVSRELTSEACGAARVLATKLKLGAAVVRALDEVFERFDGSGAPHGWRGDECSAPGRVATTAHVATVFLLDGGVPRARAALAERSGRMLDPALARRAGALLGDAPSEYVGARHDALLAFAARRGLETTADDLAEAFSDFADLQAPHARGHAREVARLCAAAANTLKLPAGERSALARAALLHDLGQVAVPTPIWTTSRLWRPTERERARAHAFFTERVLLGAPGFDEVARIAGAHHERLDGSGYHRGVGGAGVARAARVLAVADAFSAMVHERPHRAARSAAGAATELRAEAKAGRLDAEAVEAVLHAAGQRQAPLDPGALSARELEVLRLVARGKTNKEVAAALGISPRTVQHHTIHIYEKLGVDTRAGAAMAASARGLLGPE